MKILSLIILLSLFSSFSCAKQAKRKVHPFKQGDSVEITKDEFKGCYGKVRQLMGESQVKVKLLRCPIGKDPQIIVTQENHLKSRK